MKSIIIFIIFISFIKIPANATQVFDSSVIETQITLHTANGDIFGTLTTPGHYSQGSVALIIAGSGPTDRNGNNPMGKNNALEQLAYSLAGDGIASVRYDKRGVGASVAAGKNEADLRFDDYVNDASAWIDLLKNDKRFTKIIIIGHSEGSLIGMIAAANADKFISIAGVGQSADLTLKEQLSSQPQQVKDISFAILDSLKSGNIVSDVNPMLIGFFRPSVQPYLVSWFKHDPQQEIKKLNIPVLILQGTNDIQVSTNDAERLFKAYPKAKLVMIRDMNHVLKITTGDREENVKTYNQPGIPVSEILLKEINQFIKAT